MTTDINYIKLKDSIINGCDNYLSALKNKGVLKGLYHGKQGVFRATKAKEYACMIDNNKLLLSLLLAIFDSNSKGLTMCIASLLIKGNIEALVRHNKPIVFIENNFTSEVFSNSLLHKAASKASFTEISGGVLSSIITADKKSCILWILNNIYPADLFFKPITKKILDNLNNTQSLEIDKELVNENFLCFS